MTTLLLEPPVDTSARVIPAAPPAPRRRVAWPLGLAVLAVGAALLTTWSVWSGSRSDYYAAIALSMSKSWENFFFGAMDPAGTVTLDKIPGSYWIPALFVRVFGFSTWTVVLPNALAAVAAALIVATTAKRLLNPTAGLIAGGVVATTPILVAVARSNQPETFFVLGLAAVAWAASKALTRGGFGWLVVTGLFVAASFQTYMLEAWAVWPALAAAWLCTSQPWLRKLWTGAVAGVVSIAASLWWIVVVSLIPADARPYIGSTLGNSTWEMVFGYNGLGRFGATTADESAYRSYTPPFSGSAGVLRLFNDQLAGQIAWMLPAALLAVVVLWVLRFSRSVTMLLTVWLATFAAMFSAVAGMHQFYTAALAVPMALSIGLAFGLARQRGVAWPQVCLLAVTAVTALPIGFRYGGYSIPVAIAQAVLAATAIALVLWERRRMPRRPLPWIAALAGGAMLLTPLAWSAVTIAHPSSTNPVAGGVADVTSGGGLGLGGTVGRAGGGAADGTAGASTGRDRTAADDSGSARGGGSAQAQTGQGTGTSGRSGGTGDDTSEIIAYLEAHQTGTRYLAAAFGAQTAAGYIIASGGGSFLPIGGFNGRDPVPTLAAFQELIADGELRYVVISSGSRTGTESGSGTSVQILDWVQQNCTQPSDAPASTLYECTP
ncbi:MAG: glycosyltransferase family 39 protein [Microbacterium sp.]